jgi:hypothetical protein
MPSIPGSCDVIMAIHAGTVMGGMVETMFP